METNLHKTNESAIPGWFNSGAEVYFSKGEIYLNIEGSKVPFNQSPGKYQRILANAFMADKPAQRYLKKEFGITGFEQGFEQWMFCKFGGIDNTSDITANGKLVPDTFNNVCSETDCPHRGRFCGVKSHLSSHEVKTLRIFAQGKTIEQAADKLFISIPGTKSRLNAIKEKTGANNMAQLISITAHMGAI
jgi:DNA-binding CsgD family transcriptional regulator